MEDYNMKTVLITVGGVFGFVGLVFLNRGDATKAIVLIITGGVLFLVGMLFRFMNKWVKKDHEIK
jgi:hypothetical protein